MNYFFELLKICKFEANFFNSKRLRLSLIANINLLQSTNDEKYNVHKKEQTPSLIIFQEYLEFLHSLATQK